MHVEKGPPEAVIANLQLGLIAHGHIQLSFKYPQEWKFCNLSVQAVPIFSHFNCKKKNQKSVCQAGIFHVQTCFQCLFHCAPPRRVAFSL